MPPRLKPLRPNTVMCTVQGCTQGAEFMFIGAGVTSALCEVHLRKAVERFGVAERESVKTASPKYRMRYEA